MNAPDRLVMLYFLPLFANKDKVRVKNEDKKKDSALESVQKKAQHDSHVHFGGKTRYVRLRNRIGRLFEVI